MVSVRALLCLALTLAALPAKARIHRSAAAKVEFMRMNPCPATGRTKGKCAGYVIDHVVPLCAKRIMKKYLISLESGVYQLDSNKF